MNTYKWAASHLGCAMCLRMNEASSAMAPSPPPLSFSHTHSSTAPPTPPTLPQDHTFKSFASCTLLLLLHAIIGDSFFAPAGSLPSPRGCAALLEPSGVAWWMQVDFRCYGRC